MTRERAKELWPLIKAWSEGAVLEYKNAWGGWSTVLACDGGVLDHPDSTLRIKPEQREFWLVKSKEFKSLPDRETNTTDDCEIIHVKEQTND